DVRPADDGKRNIPQEIGMRNIRKYAAIAAVGLGLSGVATPPAEACGFVRVFGCARPAFAMYHRPVYGYAFAPRYRFYRPFAYRFYRPRVFAWHAPRFRFYRPYAFVPRFRRVAFGCAC